MALFETDDLEFVADYYYDDMFNFEDDNFEPSPHHHYHHLPGEESDIEDDLEIEKAKTDTSAVEVRNGKDIQGIPWERLNFTRDKYREMRLKQYNNYQSLPPCSGGQHHEEEYKQAKNANVFYDFQFNTRLVKSTIVHFQL